MNTLLKAIWKMFKVGGWAPILVFTVHMIAGGVFNLYILWPPTDIPMHFLGGLSIAFFISRCYQALPRETVSRTRIVLLEVILAISLTATVAVFWEFAEFMADRIYGSNLQVSLANTMQDLAMGISGAAVWMLARAYRLRLGFREFREIAREWVHGEIVYHLKDT